MVESGSARRLEAPHQHAETQTSPPHSSPSWLVGFRRTVAEPSPKATQATGRFDASCLAEPQPGGFVDPSDLGALRNASPGCLVKQRKVSYPTGEMGQGHRRCLESAPIAEGLTGLPAESAVSLPRRRRRARSHRRYAVGQRRRLSCPTKRSSSATRWRRAVSSAWSRASAAAVSSARVCRQRAMRHRGEQTCCGGRPVRVVRRPRRGRALPAYARHQARRQARGQGRLSLEAGLEIDHGFRPCHTRENPERDAEAIICPVGGQSAAA
jgi:hypothetical protein